MDNFFLALSKYLMITYMLIYATLCFRAAGAKTKQQIKSIYRSQNILIYLLHFTGYLVIYVYEQEQKIINLYGMQLLYFMIVLAIFPLLYSNLNRLLLSNMCMFIAIGFVMITRLDYDKCLKQFYIIACATTLTILVPFFISRISILKNLTYVYGLIGIAMLLVVLVGGSRVFGAKLNVTIGNISFQPSEFAKIFFVFFIAGMLCESARFKHIVITTVCAAIYVIVLVMSKDLGGALIFFMTYLFMLYAATSNIIYLALGLGSGGFASVIAYHFFSHVRVRVAAWRDPWSIIDTDGYQVAQSLFAISAGGWLGTGLYKGMPHKVPVVVKDFIFSAIAEEFGGIFAILLILVSMSCFIAFIRASVIQTNKFYKMIAYGFGIGYVVQVFLTIGGALKMIPSTGVTLPLVSYGGSSALSTIFVFSIIQGITVLARNEAEASEDDTEEVNVAYAEFDNDAFGNVRRKPPKNEDLRRIKNSNGERKTRSSSNKSTRSNTDKRTNSDKRTRANMDKRNRNAADQKVNVSRRRTKNIDSRR